MYFSPETVGRKISLVKLRLLLARANDVTEACNMNVYLYRGVYKLNVRGTLSKSVFGGVMSFHRQSINGVLKQQ